MSFEGEPQKQNRLLGSPSRVLTLVVLILSLNSPSVGHTAGPSCAAVFSPAPKTFTQNLTSNVQAQIALGKSAVTAYAINPAKEFYQAPFSEKASRIYRASSLATQRAFGIGAEFLSPIPLPTISKTGRLFNKQLLNAEYKPTETEANFLRDHDLSEKFRVRGQFLERNPWMGPLRVTARISYIITANVLLAMMLNQTFQMEKNTITFDDLIGDDVDEKGHLRVQLLVETAPFPHTAIRIGPKVYSYGVASMDAVAVAKYVRGENLPQASDLKSALAHIGERSLRVVNIRLSPEETTNLRRDLELATAKTYRNITGVNDCSTMLARALRRSSTVKTPLVIDAYPSTTAAYFSMRHMLGDERVGVTKMAVRDLKSARLHLVRNTWIGTIEAKAMLGLLSTNLPYRAFLDFTTSESELQAYSPQTFAQIRSWLASTREELRGELDAYGVSDATLNEIKAMPAGAERARRVELALRAVEVVLTPKTTEAREIFNSSAAEVEDILVSQTKLEYLERTRRRIEATLSQKSR